MKHYLKLTNLQHGYVFLLGTLCLFSVACSSTEKRIKESELRTLKEQKASLTQLNQVLSATPDIEGKADMSLFLSADSINAALAGFDGIMAPIENIERGRMVLESIRTEFKNGFPALKISAAAERDDLEVSLVVSAVLIPYISPSSPPHLRIKVRVIDVVPQARWSFYQFPIKRFIGELLKMKSNEYLAELPPLDMPIETKIPLVVPGTTEATSFSIGKGTVSGKYTYPNISLTVPIQINQVLALSDGLHIYLKFD